MILYTKKETNEEKLQRLFLELKEKIKLEEEYNNYLRADNSSEA